MKSITILFLLIGSFLYSQKGHRFFYELKFKKDSTAENFSRDLYILDITPGEQKFYNYEYYRNDSINKKNTKKDFIFSYPELSIRINRKNNSEFSNYFTQTPLYYVIETNDEQKWEILPEKKKYGNFDVQKATTKFGGRTWIAWFAPDLPFNYGPYKFYGLPGLILEIADSKENYIFSFKGNKAGVNKLNTTQFLETENGVKPLAINESQWRKLQIDYYLNPLKDFGEGGLIIENENGEKVQANSREIIQKQQNYLRHNNNPIEVDKAVHFPQN